MNFNYKYTVQSPDVLIFRNSTRIFNGPVKLDLQNDSEGPGRYTLISLSVSTSIETTPGVCNMTFAIPTSMMAKEKVFAYDSPEVFWRPMDHVQVYVSTNEPIVSTNDFIRLDNQTSVYTDKSNAYEKEYTMIFAGVVTKVSTNVRPERIEISISAYDYLYWLTVTKLNVKWSAIELFLRGQEHNDEYIKYMFFPNKYIGNNLKTFVEKIIFNKEESQLIALPEIDIFSIMYASLNKNQIFSQVPQLKKAFDTSKELYTNVKLTRDNGKPKEELNVSLVKKNAVKDKFAINPEKIFRANEYGFTLSGFDAASKLYSQKVNQNALGLYWEHQFQTFMRNNYISFFRDQDALLVPILWDGTGGAEPIFTIEGHYSSRMEMLQEVLDLILYEFYQAPQGLFILKPPMYNAPPSFIIDPVEIESINYSINTESILTSVSTTGILAVGAPDTYFKEIQINSQFPFVQGSYTCLFPKYYKPEAKEEYIDFPVYLNTYEEFDQYIYFIDHLDESIKQQEEKLKNLKNTLTIETLNRNADLETIEDLKKRKQDLERKIKEYKRLSQTKGKVEIYTYLSDFEKPEKIKLYPLGNTNKSLELFSKVFIFNYVFTTVIIPLKNVPELSAQEIENINALIMNLFDKILNLNKNTGIDRSSLYMIFQNFANSFKQNSCLIEDKNKLCQVLIQELKNKIFNEQLRFDFSKLDSKGLSIMKPAEYYGLVVDVESPKRSATAKATRTIGEIVSSEPIVGVPETSNPLTVIVKNLYKLTEKDLLYSQGKWNVMEYGQKNVKLTNRFVRTQDQAIAYSKYYMYIHNASAETIDITLRTLRPDIIPGFTILNGLDMCVYYVKGISFSINAGENISTNLNLIVRRQPVWYDPSVVTVDLYNVSNYLKCLANPYNIIGVFTHDDYKNFDESLRQNLKILGWEFYGPCDSVGSSATGNLDYNGLFLPPFGGYLQSVYNEIFLKRSINLKERPKNMLIINIKINFSPRPISTLTIKFPNMKTENLVWMQLINREAARVLPILDYIKSVYTVPKLQHILFTLSSDYDIIPLGAGDWEVDLRSYNPINNFVWEYTENEFKNYFPGESNVVNKIITQLKEMHNKALIYIKSLGG